jgi:hypothetical protein
MSASVSTATSRSHQGASVRAVHTNAASTITTSTSNAYWYTSGTGDFVRSGHKHPARRVLGLT